MAPEWKDVLLSPIEEAWRQTCAYDAQNYPNRLAPGSPSFVDYAWDIFDPKICLSMLISEQSTYKALKPILFSGLCTWIVCPKDIKLRQNGMLLVGVDHLRLAENYGRAAFADRRLPNPDLLGDIMGRLRGLGPDFYNDFYYPIGGLDPLSGGDTASQHRLRACPLPNAGGRKVRFRALAETEPYDGVGCFPARPFSGA